MSVINQIILCLLASVTSVAVSYVVWPEKKEFLKRLGNRRYKKGPSDFLSLIICAYFMAVAMLANIFALSFWVNILTGVFIGWGMAFVYYLFCLAHGWLIVRRVTKNDPEVKDAYRCSQMNFALDAIGAIMASILIFTGHWWLIIVPMLAFGAFEVIKIARHYV